MTHRTLSVLFQCCFIPIARIILDCGPVSTVQRHRENMFPFPTTIQAQGGSGNQQVTSRLEGTCGSSPVPAQSWAIKLLRAVFS